MALTLDPEIAAGMQKLMGGGPPPTPPPAGDYKARRQNIEHLFGMLASLQPKLPDVTRRDFEATAQDGHKLVLRYFEKKGAAPGSAIYYVHGGGMILGNLAAYDAIIAGYVGATGVPLLAVEYRLAPEHPHPTPVEDSYAGLRWLADNAAKLGVDPGRIAIMGDSAGGGIAAGVALLARDRKGPALKAQILIYPMLDDRNVKPDAAIAPYAVWSYDDNITGWGGLLGDRAGKDGVSPYAAPARATDLANLAPAYIEVGDLDIFRDEDLAYAARLVAAGVPTEFHLRPGAPHGFEGVAPDAGISKRAMADRFRAIRAI